MEASILYLLKKGFFETRQLMVPAHEAKHGHYVSACAVSYIGYVRLEEARRALECGVSWRAFAATRACNVENVS